MFSPISPLTTQLADNETLGRHPVLRSFIGYPISIIGVKTGAEINKGTAVAITKGDKQAAVTIRNLAKPDEIIQALLKG
ncbi:MAG: hypothetical protein WC608_04885 [Parcubacteria group bacterium]